MNIKARMLAGWLLDEDEGEAVGLPQGTPDSPERRFAGGPEAVRAFIEDNPRPELEAEFGIRLLSAAYKRVFCRALDNPPRVMIWMDRTGPREEFFSPLCRTLERIAVELGFKITPTGVHGRGIGNNYRVHCALEPAPG